MPSAANTANIDLFSPDFMQSQSTSAAPPLDLFADVNHGPSSTILDKEQKPSAVRLSANEGWATFDLPYHAEPQFKASQGLLPTVPCAEKDDPKGKIDLFSSMGNNSDWFSVQHPTNRGHSSLATDQWSLGSNAIKPSADSGNSQVRREI